MKLSFILGSGISIKAGLKNVSEISKIIFSGEGIARHTDSEYYFMPPLYGLKEDENVKRIINFLEILKKENYDYFKSIDYEYETNYEDLYFIVSQLDDEIFGNQKNIFVQNYLKDINTHGELILESSNTLFPDFKFQDLVSETKTYIENLVAKILYRSSEDTSYLTFFKEIHDDTEFEEINFFTLNHDVLLETYFKKNGLEFYDGFSKRNGDFEIYDSNLLNNQKRVNLIKLHGSIDWKRYREEGKDWSGDYIAKYDIKVGYDPKDNKGSIQHPIDNRSEILIGTENKLKAYNYGIASDMMCFFKQKLNEDNFLIISGYGFKDKGINLRILDWYYECEYNTIILIHHNFEKLKQDASFAVGSKMDKWYSEKRLLLIEKKFEDVTWEEIKSKINLG
ncbi:MAG: SIR2 family protein [Candidatus Cloacimonetes bacterium]|nr:SIR2 family protein [Candidatus Cloacimonadota bacterium]